MLHLVQWQHHFSGQMKFPVMGFEKERSVVRRAGSHLDLDASLSPPTTGNGGAWVDDDDDGGGCEGRQGKAEHAIGYTTTTITTATATNLASPASCPFQMPLQGRRYSC